MNLTANALPPTWSLALGTSGRVAIVLGALLFLASLFGWLFAKAKPGLAKPAGRALDLGVICLFFAFVSLGVLFVANRFEYSYIFQHGDTSNAIAYRIAGIWSGQQGSFLLWACASGLFVWFTAKGTGSLRRWYSIAYSAFLGSLAGILAFESPFNLNQVDGITFSPPNGSGLSPSLQNYWVTIHPPTIFLGFGALTVLFAYAFAALVEKDFEGWIPKVRPWALTALGLLGLGLCMGGFWAYETLGWGGFWSWDPVEDVSFVPWCLTVAFVHGIIVQTARKRGKSVNLLFGALPFLTFVYGTFLTRSGFLADASVHSFAEMDRSALKLLVGLMAVSILGFFGLFGWRSAEMKREAAGLKASDDDGSALNRTVLINYGIGTIASVGLATMIGMSIPFVQALRHQPSKVVEEGLYHQVLTWFFIPMLVLMAIAPFAPWRKFSGKDLGNRTFSILSGAVAITGLFLLSLVFTPFGKVVAKKPEVTLLGKHNLPGLAWLLFLVGVCAFVIVANLWRIYELRRQSRLGWSPFLAHIGVALLMVGLIVSRGFEERQQVMVMKNHPGEALGYRFAYRGMTSNDKDRNNELLIDVYRKDQPGTVLFTATPGMYKVPSDDGNDNTMLWPSIIRRPLYDLYVSLRPPQNEVSDPITIKEGETSDFGGLKIRYNKMLVHGTPGQVGTTFAADLQINAGSRIAKVQPSMQLGGENGPIHHIAALDDNFNVYLAGMDATDHSIRLQFQLASPMFPIDVFHKPLTIFVWLGTALMTLASLLSAVYRRVPATAKSTVSAPTPKRGKSGQLINQPL